MAYKGKFIDRAPIICPAGKMFADDTKLSLNFYPLVDQIDAVKHELGVKDEEQFPYKPRRTIYTRNQGLNTECRDCLRPPDLTRYQTVINELRETSFRSFWDQELGRVRDPQAGLPAGMDPEKTTFGKHYIREYGMTELINPPKTVNEVLWESQVGHELYRKTHNDYNPAERLHRGYLEPEFDPNRTYGHKTIYDPRGIWTDCACTWHISDSVVPTNQAQANIAERTKPQLGKCLTRNNNIKCVPEGFRFAKPCKREMCGVEELLKDPEIEPCLFKRDLMDWLTHLNELRSYIKRRKGIFIDLKDLHNSIVFHDKDKTGWIPVILLYEVCRCHNLNFNRVKMDALTLLIGIQCDGRMSYRDFINLIDVNCPTPSIVKIQDISNPSQYYMKTNVAAKCDYVTIDNREMPAAGTPSVRSDLPRPSVYPGQCKADRDNLGDETTAESIIHPCIFTNYGLSHRDLFLPRKPEFLRKLFEKLGYQIPNDTFDQLWKTGVELDKTGLVCVDTFKLLLYNSIPPPAFNAEEQSHCM